MNKIRTKIISKVNKQVTLQGGKEVEATLRPLPTHEPSTPFSSDQ